MADQRVGMETVNLKAPVAVEKLGDVTPDEAARLAQTRIVSDEVKRTKLASGDDKLAFINGSLMAGRESTQTYKNNSNLPTNSESISNTEEQK